MNFRKISFLFVALSFMMVSCGEDCDTLSSVVVGTWTVDLLGSGTIELNENGELTDSNNLIFDSSFDSADKSWELLGNVLTFNATENSQTTFYDFTVVIFDCDMMTTDNGGNSFIFRSN